jgi:hypothetical protein
MQKRFEGATRADADQKADAWLSARKDLRQIERTTMAFGDSGPSLSKVTRWAVTVHYEAKKSN